MLIITKKNDQYVTLPKLRDSKTNAYTDDATVTATLYDHTNATLWQADAADPNVKAVPGLDHVAGTYNGGNDGTYIIPIAGAFDPPRGSGYLLVVQAVSSGGMQFEVELPVTITVRTS